VLPLYKAYSKLCRSLGTRGPSPYHAAAVAAQYGADAQNRIHAAAPDVVFAPAGSNFAWKVAPGIPLVYASDATFRLIENYHPDFRRLSPRARAMTETLERRTIARADLVLYPTDWAADSAVKDYGADPARVHVVPWGANLTNPPDRPSTIGPRKAGPCRLLLIGSSWEEKGADIALATLVELQKRGLQAELVICGCTPPGALKQEGVRTIRYLNKQDRAQCCELKQLYREADFFLLPTRADCYGIVFCEAAAYGVPSIAPATGGVPYVVRDEETGILLSPVSTPADYAAAIFNLFKDEGRFKRLKQSSRDAFETRLNWQSWAQRVSQLILKL
jgi:glycosyltransferase involved in cell wall biosynthesis